MTICFKPGRAKAQEMRDLTRQSTGEMRHRLGRAKRYVFPRVYGNPPALEAGYPGHPLYKNRWIAPLCAGDKPCHADALLELANQDAP